MPAVAGERGTNGGFMVFVRYWPKHEIIAKVRPEQLLAVVGAEPTARFIPSDASGNLEFPNRKRKKSGFRRRYWEAIS